MAKEEAIRMDGKVVEILPNAMFRVKLDNMEQPIIGIISGKMRQHHINVLLGDNIEIECSVYDLTRGRIVKRK